MDREFNRFLDASAQLSEMSLLYYRNVINAGGSQKEAIDVTTAIIRGMLLVSIGNEKEEN